MKYYSYDLVCRCRNLIKYLSITVLIFILVGCRVDQQLITTDINIDEISYVIFCNNNNNKNAELTDEECIKVIESLKSVKLSGIRKIMMPYTIKIELNNGYKLLFKTNGEYISKINEDVCFMFEKENSKYLKSIFDENK